MSIEPWRILVVDDDVDMQNITKVVLRRRTWRSRPFEVATASSGTEGRKILRTQPAFHVAIVDVVMETPDAGLRLCHFIRATFSSSLRIILRTGQAGASPESSVLESYDIDYYLAKTEATGPRVFVAIRTCLRTGEDLYSLRELSASLTVANAKVNQLQRECEKLQSQIREAKGGPLNDLGRLLNDGGLKSLPPPLQQRVDQLLDATDELRQCLDVSKGGSTTRIASSPLKILILLRGKRALSVTKRALLSSDLRSIRDEDWQTSIARARAGEAELIFIEPEHLDIVIEARQRNPLLKVVLISGINAFEERGREMMGLPLASAVLVGDSHTEKQHQDPMWVQQVVVTASKLLSQDIFGPEKYMAWGAQVLERSLIRTSERADALAELREFCEMRKLRPALWRRLSIVADELMMNAMWDAPVDADGKSKYEHIPRSEAFSLEPAEAIKLKYACDGNLLAIGVSDPFGRLQQETAYSYIKKCVSGETREGHDAGLGVYMAYLAISTFIVNVEPSKKTEVIGIVPVRGTKSNMNPRSFHYFRTEDSGPTFPS